MYTVPKQLHIARYRRVQANGNMGLGATVLPPMRYRLAPFARGWAPSYAAQWGVTTKPAIAYARYRRAYVHSCYYNRWVALGARRHHLAVWGF